MIRTAEMQGRGALEARDVAMLRELTAPLAVLEDGGPPIWSRWVPQLKEALGLDHALMYGLRSEPDHLRFSLAHSAGAPRGDGFTLELLDDMTRTAGRRWGVFDPQRPESKQRNTALVFPPVDEFRAALEERQFMAERYGLADEENLRLATTGFEHAARALERADLHRRWQLRALVCHEDRLLAWIGGFEPADVPERTRAMLEAVVPAVAKRLLLEQTLEVAPLFDVAFTAALEALSRAAFLVSAGGKVQHANTLGRRLLDREAPRILAALREAVASGGNGGFEVTPLVGPGIPPHHLVVAKVGPGSGDRLALAARRWGLTPQQARVLELVVAGEPNKIVAHKLGCSDKTVEVHVTQLLAKSGASSRSALAARFWNDL